MASVTPDYGCHVGALISEHDHTCLQCVLLNKPVNQLCTTETGIVMTPNVKSVGQTNCTPIYLFIVIELYPFYFSCLITLIFYHVTVTQLVT